jgi:diguanylate cyclase
MKESTADRPMGAVGRLTAAHEPADSEDAAAETNLSARESALLARERAVELRERVADEREAALHATDLHRVYTEAQLREANERLVVASLHAHAVSDAAEQTAAQMAIKAEHDFLTGLPNRALLTDRLEQSIALAQRHNTKLALMFLDIDRFKEINDSLGHAVGDAVLQSVAKRLQGSLRKSDTVSRQGGDEFLILLTEVAEVGDAAVTADKLIKVMAQPHKIGAHRLRVTLSIGISVYPDDAASLEAVIANADRAMYEAKKSGRNTYREFTAVMREGSASDSSI